MSSVCLTKKNKEVGIAMTKFLLNEGAELDMPDETGRTAFLMACHWGLKEIVEILLKYEPNLNATTHKLGLYMNPVFCALYKENFEIAFLLL